MSKLLNVHGLIVRAPVCSQCHSDMSIVVLESRDSWTYHCVHCMRDIPLEEIAPEMV